MAPCVISKNYSTRVSFKFKLLEVLHYVGLMFDVVWERNMCSYLSKPIQHLDKGAAADGGRFVCSVGAKICTKIEIV